jgi:RNA polymerase sigma factor (sigma-70 family)
MHKSYAAGLLALSAVLALLCVELGLEHYIGSIRQIARLTPEEEAAVGAQCAAGDVSAQMRMVEANLRLVVHIAYRFQNCGLSMEDMIAEGALGLMRAAERFNPDLGSIGSYAGWWIRRSIQRAIARSRHIRLPESVAAEVHQLARAERELRLELGRGPTELELQAATEASPQAMRVFQQGMADTISLDAPLTLDGEDDFTLADQMVGEQAEPTSEKMSLVELLGPQLKDLDPMSVEVLSRCYGLDGQPPETLESIAKDLGFSRTRIAQVRDKALKRLRRKLTKFLERQVSEREIFQKEFQAFRKLLLEAT